MSEQTNLTSTETHKWLQFEKLIDLHKFYFERLISAATFSLGITGAILSYGVGTFRGTNRTEVFAILFFPIILSAGSFMVFCLGCYKTYDLNQKVDRLKGELELGWKPHTEILVWMCAIFALLFFILTVGMILLIIEPSWLPQLKTKT